MNYGIINIKNKEARFLYEIVDTEVAGIKLFGTEVKSIRENSMGLKGSWCHIDGNSFTLRNSHISEYSLKGYSSHEPDRIRTLLLTKKQLKKWDAKVREKQLTIVPLRLFSTNTGMFKLEVALVKGKKNWDKKDTIKQRDMEKDAKRELKNY